MIWWTRKKKKQRASIKQKEGSKKIEKSKEHRDAAEIKHIRYCEYIYASQAQNSQETNPLLEKWNVPEWLCRNNNLYQKLPRQWWLHNLVNMIHATELYD